MPRQSISFTPPNSAWLDRKVNVEREYRSNSEAVNDLIRKAREIELLRLRHVELEKARIADDSGVVEKPEIGNVVRHTDGMSAQSNRGGAGVQSRKTPPIEFAAGGRSSAK